MGVQRGEGVDRQIELIAIIITLSRAPQQTSSSMEH